MAVGAGTLGDGLGLTMSDGLSLGDGLGLSLGDGLGQGMSPIVLTSQDGLGLTLGDGLGLSLGDGLSVGPGAAGGSWTKTFDTVVDRAGPGRPWGPIPIHTVAPFTTCEYEISAQLADSE